MKLKFFLIPLFMMCYSPSVYADEGLDISYKFVPLEIVFASDGISFKGTKTIVTRIGSFLWGYSKYAFKFDEDYTYVIIEDMTQKIEHIYKIKDKKKLKLLSKARTEITVTRNRVRIVVEKWSRFTVKFSVDGEDEPQENSSSSTKWFSPTTREVTWKEAKEICRDNGGRLPNIEELKKVVIDCGGEMEDNNPAEWKRNKNNDNYKSCYKEKGFTSRYYWSSTTGASGTAWYANFGSGFTYFYGKWYRYYVLCVWAGQ